MVTIASWVVYIDPNLLLPKTKHQKGSKQPFEDVFPIKNGDSALSCEFSGVILTTYRNGVLSSKDPAIETKGRWSSAHVGYQRWPLLSEMPRCVFLFFLVVASDWSILTRGVYLKHSYILWSLEKKTIQIQHNLIWAHTPYMYRGYDPSFDPPQKIHVHQKHIHRQCHGKNKKNVESPWRNESHDATCLYQHGFPLFLTSCSSTHLKATWSCKKLTWITGEGCALYIHI